MAKCRVLLVALSDVLGAGMKDLLRGEPDTETTATKGKRVPVLEVLRQTQPEVVVREERCESPSLQEVLTECPDALVISFDLRQRFVHFCFGARADIGNAKAIGDAIRLRRDQWPHHLIEWEAPPPSPAAPRKDHP